MSSKITMADVARLAGVAPSTVSRALNDSPLIHGATKARIRRIAQQHGYAVNATAASLRRQSAQALGLVVPLAPSGGQKVSDPFFLEMVAAITTAAAKRGYDLLLSLPGDAGRVSQRRLLSTGRADGLIVIGQAGRHDRLNELAQAGSPIVVWGGQLGDQRYTTVGSDNVVGGRLAAEHLLSLGRRRLVFLGDPALPEVELRYTGFSMAHDAGGVRIDPALVRRAPFSGDGARAEIEDLLSNRLQFDGVVAASDLLAISAIRALHESDVSVPGDVAVVGYDDVPLAAQVSLPLTTVSQSIWHGGMRLVELLVSLLQDGTPPSEFTDTRLVVRSSCGAA
ncbi:MAG: LacI family DNA-binding transcriptional regulator [Myxococcales bacterium]|nr:LacI family DNA-binding transcriptional regulator [Myxococcales bacterium]